MEKKARLEKPSLELLLSYHGEYSYPKKWWRELIIIQENNLVIKIIN